MFGVDDVLAHVEEHEAARAVRALGHAGPHAVLPDQGSLLVTQHARDGHAAPLAARVLQVAIDLRIEINVMYRVILLSLVEGCVILCSEYFSRVHSTL